MPNWCDCELCITGPKEDLRKLKRKVKSKKSVLDADKIIPYPKEFKNLDKARPGEGFNSGGYEWCCENWGTKWGFCDPAVADNIKHGELVYTFETAWSPPIPLIKELGKLFPKLVFELRYFEGGAGFNGLFVIENGKVEVDKVGEYFGYRGG